MAKTNAVTKSKADLVDAIIADSEKADSKVKSGDVVSKAQTARIVSAVFDKIIELTGAGEKVIITNFGTFVRVDRKSRVYKTPQGTDVTKPTQNKLSFKSSKSLTKNAE